MGAFKFVKAAAKAVKDVARSPTVRQIALEVALAVAQAAAQKLGSGEGPKEEGGGRRAA